MSLDSMEWIDQDDLSWRKSISFINICQLLILWAITGLLLKNCEVNHQSSFWDLSANKSFDNNSDIKQNESVVFEYDELLEKNSYNGWYYIELFLENWEIKSINVDSIENIKFKIVKQISVDTFRYLILSNQYWDQYWTRISIWTKKWTHYTKTILWNKWSFI